MHALRLDITASLRLLQITAPGMGAAGSSGSSAFFSFLSYSSLPLLTPPCTLTAYNCADCYVHWTTRGRDKSEVMNLQNIWGPFGAKSYLNSAAPSS